MNPVLERRMRKLRARALIRAWEYRQRNHARGSWFRLRRVLADATEAYLVSSAGMQQLLEEGVPALDVGREFSPPKVIVFTDRQRIARLPEIRQVPVRLGVDLLAAEYLALVPFDGLTPTSSRPDLPPSSAESPRRS